MLTELKRKLYVFQHTLWRRNFINNENQSACANEFLPFVQSAGGMFLYKASTAKRSRECIKNWRGFIFEIRAITITLRVDSTKLFIRERREISTEFSSRFVAKGKHDERISRVVIKYWKDLRREKGFFATTKFCRRWRRHARQWKPLLRVNIPSTKFEICRRDASLWEFSAQQALTCFPFSAHCSNSQYSRRSWVDEASRWKHKLEMNSAESTGPPECEQKPPCKSQNGIWSDLCAAGTWQSAEIGEACLWMMARWVAQKLFFFECHWLAGCSSFWFVHLPPCSSSCRARKI